MNEQIQETRHRLHWIVGACAARLLAQPRLCGAFAPRCKVALGRSLNARSQCCEEWRPLHNTKGHGLSRVVWTRNAKSGIQRTGSTRFVVGHTSGEPPRLQAVCMHPVSAGLRPTKARRETRLLPANRLHGRGSNERHASDGRASGTLATRQKNRNGSPATGRTPPQTSRHGTNGAGRSDSLRALRPATGQTPRLSASPSSRHGSPI